MAPNRPICIQQTLVKLSHTLVRHHPTCTFSASRTNSTVHSQLPHARPARALLFSQTAQVWSLQCNHTNLMYFCHNSLFTNNRWKCQLALELVPQHQCTNTAWWRADAAKQTQQSSSSITVTETCTIFSAHAFVGDHEMMD